MAAKETKVYPVSGFYINGVPHVEQTVESKAEADALIATGAFTDDPRHPDRLRDGSEATTETPETPGSPAETE